MSSTGVDGQPSHRRGKVVDDKILEAVISVIGTTGTLSIKVEEVAEIAGVNKTTIYRRFPKRDDLVLAAVMAHADLSIPLPDEGSLRSDLLVIAQLVRATVTSPLGQALLGASVDNSALAELRPVFWSSRFSAAAEVLRRAEERNECPPIDNPEFLVELLVAPIHFRASQTGTEVTDEFLEVQVDRLLREVAG